MASVETSEITRNLPPQRKPVLRTVISLALALGLYSTGEVLVKGEGNPVQEMLRFQDLHLQAPSFSLRSLRPQREPQDPRFIKGTITDILNAPVYFTKNAISSVKNSLPVFSDQPILDQAKDPDIRNEWGYNLWDRPVYPNLARESLGHFFQFGGLAFVLRLRSKAKVNAASKDLENEKPPLELEEAENE